MDTRELSKRFPAAFAALPECYQNDDILSFYQDSFGVLWAREREGIADLSIDSFFDGKEWTK